MGILAWIIFGLIAGAIAQIILPGDDPGGGGLVGWLITMIIGIVGAVVGGFIGTALGFGGIDKLDFGSLMTAVAGGVLLLIIWRMVAGSGGHGRRGLA